MENATFKTSSLRWRILRQAILHRSRCPDEESEIDMKRISRKSMNGFNLIPSHLVRDDVNNKQSRDVIHCYNLPFHGSSKLFLTQRGDDHANVNDFEICNNYDIDNTGLVCQWPSEEVLAYFCVSHANLFRSKRVIELGSGYGLAGLVIAAVTEASEVIISDGNPQVVEYIERNINANSGAFGDTRVKSMILHWNHEEKSTLSNCFDLIVASDCTFFKEFHKGLAQIVKLLLKGVGLSEAIFFNPKRGNSLDKFLEEIKNYGLQFTITENYDSEVWKRHLGFMNGEGSWPGYEKDHCFPLLVRITL